MDTHGTLIVMLHTWAFDGLSRRRTKSLRLQTYHMVTRDEAQTLVDLYAEHESRNFLGFTWEVTMALHIER
jgi:hypothetical protein